VFALEPAGPISGTDLEYLQGTPLGSDSTESFTSMYGCSNSNCGSSDKLSGSNMNVFINNPSSSSGVANIAGKVFHLCHDASENDLPPCRIFM
jgi:hypothetical protein